MLNPAWRLLFVTIVVIVGTSLATSSIAQPDGGSGSAADRRWVPSLAIFTAGLPEDRSAEADSVITPFQDGESVGFPWSVGGEAAVASPVLFDSPLKPRFVVHAGAGYVLDSDDPVSTRGDPGSTPFVSPSQPDPASIENQGSAVRAQAKPWVLTGGLGTIVEFELFERTVFVRPTLEWMYRKDTVQALFGRGEGEALDGNGNCAPCRILFIDAETEKGYHSLGGGLETGIDGGRAGDFLLRFFASARVYHILGDRKTAISPAGTWRLTNGGPSSRNPPTTTFDVRYEREPVHYRLGIGLQLLWLPE